MKARRPIKRRLAAAALLAAGMLVIWLVVLSVRIVAAGEAASDRPADVAIVLGAAVYGHKPSPVFEERIRHGIHLYKRGAVRKLLFTGGFGGRASTAESLVARSYALGRGVPPGAILTETRSRTTQQNLVQARRLMRAHRLRTALLVTDPLHIMRAMRISSGLGVNAWASPTPTSRYRTWRSKAGFLLREVYFYNVHLLTGR